MQILKPNLPLKILGQGRSWPGESPVTNLDILKSHPKHKNKDENKLKKFADKLSEQFGFTQRNLSRLPRFENAETIDVLEEETSETLAIKATKQAVKCSPEKNIASLVHGTTTSSRYTGSQAPVILAEFNNHAPAYEMKTGCSTSLSSLHMGLSLLSMGYENVMVSCAETLSKTINPDLQETWFLLADGGASIWLEKNESNPDFIVKQCFYNTDGHYAGMYTTHGKLPPHQKALDAGGYYMFGDGAALREQALKRYTEMLNGLFPNKKDMEKVHWLIPHQINRALIDEVTRNVGFDAEKIWDADEFGNIGGSSVLFSLARAVEENRFESGDEIVMMSVGGGLSYAIQHWVKV